MTRKAEPFKLNSSFLHLFTQCQQIKNI